MTAAALILGENIGTTITAFLASLGAFTNARRAAYAHVAFNVIGVFWITLLFVPYTNLISRIITKTQICDISAIVVQMTVMIRRLKDYAGVCRIPETVLYFPDAETRHVNSLGETLDAETSYVLASDLEKFVDKHRLPDLPLYTTHGVEYPFTQPAIAFTHSGFNIANTLSVFAVYRFYGEVPDMAGAGQSGGKAATDLSECADAGYPGDCH